MAILKCKQCGGDIQATDKTYGTCANCGVTSTLPSAADDQKANLFNRANHLRRQNEFDKAATAYENILNLDAASAEAHWGVVLSRYGIEYVEEAGQRIPTCHRVQNDSILTDADYLAALDNAEDEYTKSLYERDAREIAEIQKSILAISSKEQPYDVFICYKETTDGGTRTKDSTLAQDLYYQLEKEGYRVFFSRITLERKLGQQYEPYIFSALNSAKVMLVVGTKPEHFNAVWVKNEWSRFLALAKKDRSRLLIPCYRDMDAYDLPEEMAMLQSQDMGKIGFVQDVVHGIKKVMDGAKASVKQPSATAPTTAAPGLESLMKRGWLFLEDLEWKQADEYFDKVLDIAPEHAPAYLGKLCAEVEALREEELGDVEKPISDHNYFKKAIRFSTPEIQTRIKGYDEKIRERLRQDDYDKLVREKNNASTEEMYSDLAKRFRSMNGYKNTADLADDCDNLAVLVRYKKLMNAMKMFQANNRASNENEYSQLAKQFRDMNGYKDTTELADECEQQSRKRKKYREELERLELERQRLAKEEEEHRENKKRQAEERRKTCAAFAMVIQIVITGIYSYMLWENGIKQLMDKPLWGFPFIFGIIPTIGFISLFFRRDTGYKFPFGICILGFIIGITTIAISVEETNYNTITSIILTLLAMGISYGLLFTTDDNKTVYEIQWDTNYFLVMFKIIGVGLILTILGGIMAALEWNTSFLVYGCLLGVASPIIALTYKAEASW